MPGRSGFLRLVLAVVWLLKAVAVGAQGADANTRSQPDLPDLSIEDLLNLKVYAASRYDQDIGRAPASVSIITADEIRTHGYRTLADALRSVRGFYVSYDRNYSYIGVRGFERPGDYNGRILLLVNGHQLNDTIFEEALLGTESPIDLALIERIVQHQSQIVGAITVSIGVAALPQHGSTPAHLIEAADRALYEAKARGRDRTVSADVVGRLAETVS